MYFKVARARVIAFLVIVPAAATLNALAQAPAKRSSAIKVTSAPSPLPPTASPTPAPQLEIKERFWIKPGPKQDSAKAPRLLIMYPLDNTQLDFGTTKTRYAGRVEPADAKVRLNGQDLQIWPGGVFTGLLEPPVGRTVYQFVAESGGGKTTTDRVVTRAEDMKLGPAAWPLALHPAIPISPGDANERWLRPGSKLAVKLRGSPGHRAAARIGPNGKWTDLPQTEANEDSGGVYSGELIIDDTVPETPAPVMFRLSGREKGGSAEQVLEAKSNFMVRRLPADKVFAGRITKNLGTYLKNREGWDRYGVWWRGTPFPLVERLGDRVSVDFGPRGGDLAKGFVEIENVELDPRPAPAPMPTMAAPRVVTSRWGDFTQATLEWPLAAPVATVFETGGDATRGWLHVHLPGAGALGEFRYSWGGSDPISMIQSVTSEAGRPPRIEFELANAALWGYGWRVTSGSTLQLQVRVLSATAKAPNKPLAGFKIMIDPGHGGEDEGALGPSGIAETDLNMVVSNHLERELRALGADVRQLRHWDFTLGLDDRVDQAWAYDPDLFLSVHHNSVAMEADPMSDAGPKVFYHYNFAAPLAAAVAARLAETWGGDAKPRIFYDVFRVNRNVTLVPSILLEMGFVCNPVDEVRLRQTDFLKKMAKATAQGVVDVVSPASAAKKK